MISPTVFARRCLCYLMSDMLQEALGDAMQAQVISPDWPTAFYLQAAALFSLGMDNDAQESLKDGTSLDAKKYINWKCIDFFFLSSIRDKKKRKKKKSKEKYSLYLSLCISSLAVSAAHEVFILIYVFNYLNLNLHLYFDIGHISKLSSAVFRWWW